MSLQEPVLEAFREKHSLDDKSFKSLSELAPGDQIIVMDTVNNKQCNNPSAYTWSQVRRMHQEPGPLRLAFVHRSVDERCLEKLQSLPKEVQEQIAAQVDVTKCRNINAMVVSKIKNFATQPGYGRGPPPAHYPDPRRRSRSPRRGEYVHQSRPGGREGALQAEVEQLRRELALVRGQASAPPPRGGQGAHWQGQQGPPGKGEHHRHYPPSNDDEVADFGRRVGLDPKACKAIRDLETPEEQRIVMGCLEARQANLKNPSAVAWSIVKRVRENPEEAKHDYVRQCLDGDVLPVFEQLTPAEQQKLTAAVDLTRVRNVSSFVWSRIRQDGMRPARRDHPSRDHPSRDHPPERSTPPRYNPVDRVTPPPGYSDDAMDAAKRLGLDDKCLNALAELPQDAQMAILNDVQPNCRNPSAFVWSKVKSQVLGKGKGKGSGNGQRADRRDQDQEWEDDQDGGGDWGKDFLLQELDDKCRNALSELPSHQQKKILADLPENCRNPSAWVWSKVKAIKGIR
eukprot:TRINITY_DN4082_c0_g1_i1.p1 TRINITY_DN4082_c0_g1~~TRINITY_DN4082_c0_g1_i1.p1  ORF type:complete len:512 (-),score=99.81 TRINITY_DN4082_c0_g1_i1:96-1631(-)